VGIRARFLSSFFISLIVGLFIAFLMNGISRNRGTDYSREIASFNSHCVPLFDKMEKNINNIQQLQSIINDSYYNIVIVNKEGDILLKPKEDFENKIDVQGLLGRKKQTNFHENQIKYYDIKLFDKDRYVVVSKFLIKGDQWKYFLLGTLIFILLFLILTYGRVKYIDILSKGLMEISKGALDYVVEIKGKDELSVLGENINYMTQELRNMKDKEEKAEKNKDTLIINVSHDLRTPLTSIVGYVKLLKEKYQEKDETSRYIDIIDDKAHRLEELINDLFEYTKLTSCDIQLQKMDISLNEFMRQIVAGMMPLCSQNNLNVLLQEPEEELYINIDPVKMVRVFENIIINAVKYSNKPGNISIQVIKHEYGAIVSVKNEGKTIKNEDLNKVFERFYRTDEARNSQTGGSGLGLAIAKSIVDLHNGKIWTEVEENKVILCVLII